MKQPIVIKSFGTNALLVEWHPAINLDIHTSIVLYNKYVTEKFSEVIIETVISYTSLAIYLKENVSVCTIQQELKTISLKNQVATKTLSSKLFYVPVCYQMPFAIDIEEVSKILQISISEIIKLHTAVTYKVYFNGFLPGFPYLGVVDKKLQISRKETPRNTITAGSVGIAENQTGIYPTNSPGGWQIIGRTPLQLFDVASSPPALFQAGDFVQFYEVTKLEYATIAEAIEKGTYHLRKEVYNA